MADPFMNQQSIKDLVLRWHEVDLEDGAADRLVALVNLHAETFNEYANNPSSTPNRQISTVC